MKKEISIEERLKAFKMISTSLDDIKKDKNMETYFFPSKKIK